MIGWPRFAVASAAFLVAAIALPAPELALVTRVIDGDTLEIRLAGRLERVRLIGVDTPETVHPQKPVERFGREASAFTRGLAEGKEVRRAKA